MYDITKNYATNQYVDIYKYLHIKGLGGIS